MSRSDTPPAGPDDHLDEVLGDLALCLLPAVAAARAREHLERCPRCAAELAATSDTLGGLPLGLRTVAPAPAVRDRLLAEVAGGGRLHRFAAQVADLLGIAVEGARAALDRLDAPGAWSPLPMVGGVSLCLPSEKAPRLKGCAVAFLQVLPGGLFPEHTHLAGERVLVLQGGYRVVGSDHELHPGEVHASDEGTSHAFRALDDGPACIVLAVVDGHIRIGDLVL